MADFLEIFRDDKGGRRDPVLFLILLGLAFGGLLILYPASALTALRQNGDSAFIIKRQLIWFALGLVAFLLTVALPLEALRRLALPLMGLAIFLLVLVFAPGIGHSVSSSSQQSFRRWIGAGELTMQPSEFAKAAIVLYLARTLERRDFAAGPGEWNKLFTALILPGVATGSILLEPQFGTTVCLLVVIGTLVVVAGFPFRRLAALFLAAAPLFLILAYFSDYRRLRLRVWLDPYAYRHEGGYQLVTAFRAFREGGLAGTETAGGFAHRYLTYGHTDFILALLGEDYGFLGVLALFALYLALLWRGFHLLCRQRNNFAFLLGAGALFMLIFQALVNIFVVTGLAPTTGISLPFVSYGGSSLISSFILGGLLLNATRERTSPSGSRGEFY